MNNQLSTITNVDISKPADFAALVLQAKAMQNALEAFWGAVDTQMLDRGITSLKGDWGSVTQAERINWKVNTSQVDPYYLKPTADTRKLRAAWEAGELPEGADFTTSTYITKRIKVEA